MTICPYLRPLLDRIIKNIELTLNAFKAEGKALTYSLTIIGKDGTHFLIAYIY